MTPLVLALDVGTTNAKAQVFDGRGRGVSPLVKARVPLAPNGTADATDLAESVDTLLDQALASWEQELSAVAFTSAWHGLVGLDGRGRPVTKVSSWLDTRAADEVALLKERVGDPEAVHQRTGAPIHPSFPPVRLLWLARHCPQSFERAARWAALGEFLEVHWFGSAAGPSLSMASGSGLYDQFAGAWDPELAQALGLPDSSLAPLVDGHPPETSESGPSLPAVTPGRLGLRLLPAFARRWPVLAGVPWLPARGDGACALLGSGCAGHERPLRAALTVGTSAAVRVLVPRSVRLSRPLSPGLFGYLLDWERGVVGASRSNAGSLIAWARETLWLGEELRKEGFREDPVVLATAGRMPGAHGLRARASLGGERSPRWPADARAAISGLRTDSTALDILQALLEDSVLGLADAIRELEAWAGPVRLVLSGGGARSPGWHHLLADATGRPIVVSKEDEASLRGAALAALETYGWLEEDALEPRDGEVVVPDPERAAAFGELAGRECRAEG